MAEPIIILVEPQMGENIGAAARAMANFGLTDLRIVKPRDGWPNPKADEMSAGGIEIIKNARIYNTPEEAIIDINYLVASSARRRDMEKEHLSLGTCFSHKNSTGKVGIMFGRENNGLTNEEVVLADTIVSIPTSPEYPSLNVAQAVNIFCYEWFTTPQKAPHMPKDIASKSEVIKLFKHLEDELDKSKFFKVEKKRQKMVRNIRNMIGRSQMSHQEVQTFRGIISSLSSRGQNN